MVMKVTKSFAPTTLHIETEEDLKLIKQILYRVIDVSRYSGYRGDKPDELEIYCEELIKELK
jgi:hypothetical protein